MNTNAYIVTLFQHFADTPWYARALGIIGACLTTVVGDPLFGALGLLVASAGVDWMLGRELAKRERRYDKTVAMQGWQVKAGTIAVVLIIKAIEIWLISLPEEISFNTHGAVSAGMAVLILVDELDSIDENIRDLGGRGIPLLRNVLAWLRSLTGRWLPAISVPVDANEERGS